MAFTVEKGKEFMFFLKNKHSEYRAFNALKCRIIFLFLLVSFT